MRRIILKKLAMVNFKGAANVITEFGRNLTIISGRNGLGKSRHMEAFLWLLTGKDSEDRKDYEVKTRDANGEQLHKVDCMVSAEIEADGEFITIERRMVEEWARPRGQQELVFKGNKTELAWNGVPVKVAEFNQRMAELVDPTIFKAISNPRFFLTMDWKAQRQMLLEMAGAPSNEDIAKDNADFVKLLNDLTGKSLEDYRKEVKAEKRKIQEELKEIQPRIDQVCKMMPEAEDWVSLEAQKSVAVGKRNKVLEARANEMEAYRQRNEAILKMRAQVVDLRAQLSIMMSKAEAEERTRVAKANSNYVMLDDEIQSKRKELARMEKDLEMAKAGRDFLKEEMKKKEEAQDALRKDWIAISSKRYDGSDICPCCGQKMPEALVMKAVEAFNDEKKRQIDECNRKGLARKMEIVQTADRIKDEDKNIEELEANISLMQASIQGMAEKLGKMQLIEGVELNPQSIPGYEETENKAMQLEAKLANMPEEKMGETMDNEMEDLDATIENINARLANKELIRHYEEEVRNLEARGKELAGLAARIECQEFTCDRFIKARIEAVEHKINGMFTMLKFKMFDTTVDGNEFECCIPMLDGAYYSSANKAKQINAGLDAINAISRRFNVAVPIFIDNAESCNDFLGTMGQQVRLVVSDGDLEVRQGN